MKTYLITGYLVIALIVSVFFNSCSNTSNKPYAFNLGKALVWPFSLILRHDF